MTEGPENLSKGRNIVNVPKLLAILNSAKLDSKRVIRSLTV